MGYIIIVRINNGQLWAISDDEVLAEFDTYEEAEELMKKHPLGNQDVDIIQVEV